MGRDQGGSCWSFTGAQAAAGSGNCSRSYGHSGLRNMTCSIRAETAAVGSHKLYSTTLGGRGTGRAGLAAQQLAAKECLALSIPVACRGLNRHEMAQRVTMVFDKVQEVHRGLETDGTESRDIQSPTLLLGAKVQN